MTGDEARFPDYVAALSGSLATVVQYFAAHRVSEAHTWILAARRIAARASDLRTLAGVRPSTLLPDMERELGRLIAEQR